MNSNAPSHWFTVFIASSVVAIICWLSLFPPRNGNLTWWEDHTNMIIITLLISGLLFFFFNKTRLMVVAFAGCGLISFVLNERTNQPAESPAPAAKTFPFRIGHFSLSSSQANPDSMLRLLHRIDADLISIQDIPPDRFPRIHEFMLGRGYDQFQVITAPTGLHLEMAVYSRRRLEYASLTSQQPPATISGRFQLSVSDSLTEFLFVAANLAASPHPLPLYLLARELQRSPLPAFVLGNFNRVPWSTEIQDFKKTSALRDSRPPNQTIASRGRLMILEKPKCHIFHSHHFKCISFETIEGLGIVGTYQFIKNGRKSHVKKTSQKF